MVPYAGVSLTRTRFPKGALRLHHPVLRRQRDVYLSRLAQDIFMIRDVH